MALALFQSGESFLPSAPAPAGLSPAWVSSARIVGYSVVHEYMPGLPEELASIEMSGEHWLAAFDGPAEPLAIYLDVPPALLAPLGADRRLSPLIVIDKFLRLAQRLPHEPRVRLLRPYVEQAWVLGYNLLILTN